MRKLSARAFTLIELLVVIGIIAVLISVLLPALMGARRQANLVQCSGNLRQVCVALLTYASEYKGCFPPNTAVGTRGSYWYDRDRAGRLLRGADTPTTFLDVRGRAVTCPEDSGRVMRSYAMNLWASCSWEGAGPVDGRGEFWRQHAKGSSTLILATEAWSYSGSEKTGWVPTSTVGLRGDSPGRRFGAGGGLSPTWFAGRFGYVNCDLPYYRHRASGMDAAITEPRGRVNIGYADGHVATKTERELADPDTGLSTLDSRWSPMDKELNDKAAGALQ